MKWNRLLGIVFTLTLLIPLNAGAQETMCQAEVQAFVTAMDNAARSDNHQQMMGYFAQDAKIKVMLDNKTLVYTPSEYLEKMNSGATESAGGHTYQSKIQSVQIQQNRAMVVLTVNEKINTQNFGTFASTADEVAMIQKQNGKLWITQLVSKVKYDQKF